MTMTNMINCRNLGLKTISTKATQENSFEIFVKDFDKTKKLGYWLSYSDKEIKYHLEKDVTQIKCPL